MKLRILQITHFRVISSLLFISLYTPQVSLGQCCSTNLVEDSGYENAITVNENFPYGTGTNNAATGGTAQWYYADGINSLDPTIISDASRASAGNQFVYVPIGGVTPFYNRCIGNFLSYTADLSTCTMDNYTDGIRYVTHYDWVAFNEDVPGGGTGSTRPTFEFQSPFTILDLYDESGTIVSANTTAVGWDDIASSWQRVYGITPMISDNNGITVWYSHINTATCGILMDDAYFAPLVINSATPSNIQPAGLASQITFELNPSSNLGPVPNINYSVSAPSGYSISPSTGVYGTNTTFTLTINSGTMEDDGDVTMEITVYDEINTSCTVIASVTNPFDIDKDGINNDIDIDTDGDGIEDTSEYLTVDPLGDEDGDGTLNFEDTIDNGSGDGSNTDYTDNNTDGVPDVFDADGDGIVNHMDLDSDNDGIPDILESGGVDFDGDGIGDSTTDTDADGLVDLYDSYCYATTNGNAASQSNSGVANPDNSLNDPGTSYARVGNGDWIKLNMGVTVPSGTTIQVYLARNGSSNSNTTTQQISQSATENGTYSNLQVYTSTQNTSVGPEIFNYTLTSDAQYIEVRRLTRSAALYGLAFSFSQSCTNGIDMPIKDTDGDGLLDFIDLDADNDGIPDLVEVGGIDSDGDGIVDNTTDLDGDGFYDVFDSDDDGAAGIDDPTNPIFLTSGVDTNGDGFANDVAINFIDGDGNSLDTDSDGYTDHLDLDSDNDGIPDIIEVEGSSPNADGKVNTGAAPWDSDNDGLADLYDENNSGISLVKTTSDSNSDGKVNSAETMIAGGSNNINYDNHGLPNHLDLDADNDGITDVVENASGDVNADESGAGDLDGVVDNFTDSGDSNGWNDSSTTATVDTDGDGIPDFLDLDSDNDGIVDYLESVCSGCPTFSLNPLTNNTDSDENGVLDIYEGLSDLNGSSGSNIGATPNVDDDSGNTTPDYLDTDTDNDGTYDWTDGYDLNNNGQAADDLITMATNYEVATSNGYYVNATDTDSDGIPDWLDNIPSTTGYDENLRPPFLNPASSFWHDDDNDGLVDLLDASENGTSAPTPDNNGGNDLDWRDMTALIALPVELSNFEALQKDCDVKLIWTTASEKDFDYFEIQWSGDGYNYSRIGFEESTGNITGDHYFFVDKTPSQHNYYRLKMVDLDGSTEFSQILYVNLDCEQIDMELNVFPTPISKGQPINVEFISEKMKEEIIIVDLQGRIVHREDFETQEGKNNLSIDISNLAAGIYQIQIVGNRTSKKVIIQE